MRQPSPTLFEPLYSPQLRSELLDLLAWRRDVRSFRRDPLPSGAIERLVAAACLSPSVGLSEPWRFVRVVDPARRAAVRQNFENTRTASLLAQDRSRQEAYARLKLAGLDDAPEQLAVFAEMECAQGHGLGRHTMEATLEYSVAIAIHTLWLAARVDGIGVGWVSIVDPEQLTAALDVPPSWRLIGYLCLGYPAQEAQAPELQRAGWERRREPSTRLIER